MAARRILQMGHYYGGTRTYGQEQVIMNLYRHMDRDRYQFDFLVPEWKPKFDTEDEILELGGRVFRDQCVFKDYIRQRRSPMGAFLKFYPEIEGIHINGENWNFVYVWSVMQTFFHKTPVRAVHSHNTLTWNDMTKKDCFRHLFGILFAQRFSNMSLSCSKAAGEWFHMKDFTVLKNGVDVEKFRFDDSVRQRMRREKGLEDKFVIGFAGRLVPQKNPLFIIDFMKEVNCIRSDAVCVILGDGLLEPAVRKHMSELGVTNVILEGYQYNVSDYMCMFDCFCLPSAWEGLGYVLIEAQTSGLRCFASRNCQNEANVTGRVQYLSLDAKLWARQLCAVTSDLSRESWANVVREKGYDIKRSAEILMDMYDTCFERSRG